MNVIIAGGRDFEPNHNYYMLLKELLTELKATWVFTGGAKGADSFGEYVARQMQIPTKRFNANWRKYGKAAGPIRNREMAKNADALIALPGGNGTQNMIKTAERYNLQIHIVHTGKSLNEKETG